MKMRPFLPHRFSPPVWRAMRWLAPVVLALRDRIAAVDVDGADRARLAALKGRGALLAPNHPSETDPSVVACAAYTVGEPFFFVATDEIFVGLVGWLVRRMGVFSIRRGRPDRASLRACRAILTSGRKLVLFPEGETHLRHEALLPLHGGAAYLALKTGAPIVPVIVVYAYRRDPTPSLQTGAARLERALGLPVDGNAPLPERLRRAGLAVLARIEAEYGLASGDELDERVARIGAHIEARVIAAVGGPAPIDPAASVRMRALFNRVYDFEGPSRALLADLWRYQNFMAIDAGVLPERPAPGHLGQLLAHLEIEVFGRQRTRPWRVARVRVGEALAAEAADRKALTGMLRARMEAMLREALDGL